jgi:hypothetical protein
LIIGQQDKFATPLPKTFENGGASADVSRRADRPN